MATWTVAAIEMFCGACSRQIPAGEPVQLLTVQRLIRCVDHATEPVNWEAVDLERGRLEAQREREAMQRPETGSGPVRVRAGKPKAFRQIGELFDAKAVAAGRDE